jgi:membrane protein DedA with SNARE-associated domain
LVGSIDTVITKALSDYGYMAIFALMALESACIPIPSEVTMVFGGALTTSAVVGSGHELSLVWVGVAGILGNLAGSWAAYGVGAWGGRPLIDRFGRYLLIRPHEVDRAQSWFEQRGELTVFVSRLLPVIRTFISLPAGIARMRLRTFTAYTLLGCIPFVYALAIAGHVAGANWEHVRKLVSPISWVLAGALVILGVVYVARRWKTVRAEYAALDAQRAAER